MTYYQGQMVRADQMDGEGYKGWVFIEWLYPGQSKYTAVKDVKRIEKNLKREGLRGWLATSERDHTTMHKILEKMGARKYNEDHHALYFMKEVI